MGVQAVGAYFDELVVRQGLKVKAVTKSADVAANYISRLLSGATKEPAGITLRRVTRAVGGSWEDVGRLLEENATPAMGREAAERWLDGLTPDVISAIEELKQTEAGRDRLREAARRHIQE